MGYLARPGPPRLEVENRGTLLPKGRPLHRLLAGLGLKTGLVMTALSGWVMGCRAQNP